MLKYGMVHKTLNTEQSRLGSSLDQCSATGVPRGDPGCAAE